MLFAISRVSLRAKKSSKPIRDDATDTRVNDAGATARMTSTCGAAYGASLAGETLSSPPALSTFPTTNWVAVLTCGFITAKPQRYFHVRSIQGENRQVPINALTGHVSG
jgi:hypothetical protein